MNSAGEERSRSSNPLPPAAPVLRIRIFPAMLLIVAAVVWIVGAMVLATIVVSNHVASWMHAGTPGWAVVTEFGLSMTLLIGGCCLLFSGIACWRADWLRMLLIVALPATSLGTIYFVQRLFGVAHF